MGYGKLASSTVADNLASAAAKASDDVVVAALKSGSSFNASTLLKGLDFASFSKSIDNVTSVDLPSSVLKNTKMFDSAAYLADASNVLPTSSFDTLSTEIKSAQTAIDSAGIENITKSMGSVDELSSGVKGLDAPSADVKKVELTSFDDAALNKIDQVAGTPSIKTADDFENLLVDSRGLAKKVDDVNANELDVTVADGKKVDTTNANAKNADSTDPNAEKAKSSEEAAYDQKIDDAADDVNAKIKKDPPAGLELVLSLGIVAAFMLGRNTKGGSGSGSSGDDEMIPSDPVDTTADDLSGVVPPDTVGDGDVPGIDWSSLMQDPTFLMVLLATIYVLFFHDKNLFSKMMKKSAIA
jgi:hypothetical protein